MEESILARVRETIRLMESAGEEKKQPLWKREFEKALAQEEESKQKVADSNQGKRKEEASGVGTVVQLEQSLSGQQQPLQPSTNKRLKTDSLQKPRAGPSAINPQSLTHLLQT